MKNNCAWCPNVFENNPVYYKKHGNRCWNCIYKNSIKGEVRGQRKNKPENFISSKIKTLFFKGQSIRAISQKLLVDRSTVRYHLKKNGLYEK